ncbi:MAG TPA: hypothetical protein VJ740_12710, partial [Hyphomicrobiaceae bacterium]|nr:hypothetical protein [Hyphomicrobiaceae bacterium]
MEACAGARLRVRSRRIEKKLGWGSIVEAFEPGLIVAVDEALQEGVALGVGEEFVLALVAGDAEPGTDGLGETAVEALDEAVGLRPERPDETVLDAVPGAHLVEAMPAGGVALRPPPCGPEAVCELRAVVGEDGVHLVREGGDEALQTAGNGGGIAPGDGLDMHEAGGAIDGHEHEGGLAVEAGEMLEIDMDEADGGGLEGADLAPGRLGARRDAVTLEAAMD